MPEFLFVFAHTMLEFRIPELESVCSYFSITATFDREQANKLENPFLFVTFDTEENAKTVASRLVLLRYVLDVWGHGNTMADCVESTKHCPAQKLDPWCGPDSSFKFLVEGFGRHYSRDDKRTLMEEFAEVRLPSRCDMVNPQCLLWIVTEIGMPPLHVDTDPPSHVYFGRQVCEGRREWEFKITLKKRQYLGTTSTSSELSLLFANQARVGKGKVVWDPCCGTASILVACAFLGATCFGSDVDWRVMHGKDGKNIQSNFTQYGFGERLLGFCMTDVCQHSIRRNFRFDAIVADPPYGIREGTRRVHPNEESDLSNKFRGMGRHATQMEKAEVGSVLAGLLRAAASMLVMNGRLVFLMPCVAGQFQPEDIPRHACFKLIANSEQGLTQRWSRRLITMEKIREPTNDSELELDTSYDVRAKLYPGQM